MAPMIDNLQTFLFEKHHIRGVLVRLSDSFHTIMQQHAYPPVIQEMLGEALVATVLMAGRLRYAGNLTLQFTASEGPISMLVAKCDHALHIRGLVQWDESRSDDLLRHALDGGQLMVMMEPVDRPERYQGCVERLPGQTFAQAMETYFVQSEQLPSRMWLTVDGQQASGLMLQYMPGATADAAKDALGEQPVFMEKVADLINGFEASALLQASNMEILQHFSQQGDDVRVFEAQPVAFRCDCMGPRMENAVRTLGQTEADAILSSHRYVSVTCQFCNRQYDFERADVDRIFANSTEDNNQPGEGPETRH